MAVSFLLGLGWIFPCLNLIHNESRGPSQFDFSAGWNKIASGVLEFFGISMDLFVYIIICSCLSVSKTELLQLTTAWNIKPTCAELCL